MDLFSLSPPTFTAVDGVTQGVAAVVYFAIGLAVWLRATHDIRTRVFLALALANVAVLGIPTVWWLRGMKDPSKLSFAATAVILTALGVGTLLLFHFTQVFPRRRPWIRAAGPQMTIAYGLVPVAILGLLRFLPDSVDKFTVPYIIALLIFGFPLLVLLGVVLPVTGIVSLLRSCREISGGPLAHLRKPLELILLSQIAGGTLAILFAPVLTLWAPNSVIQSVLTVVIWLVGLLTPVAVAMAVFKLNVLAVDAD